MNIIKRKTLKGKEKTKQKHSRRFLEKQMYPRLYVLTNAYFA
jgi:hypothetical protein